MPAVDAVTTEPDEARNSKNLGFVNRVSRKKAELTIKNIHAQSPVLAELHEAGVIDSMGAMYDVATGKVEFFDRVSAGIVKQFPKRTKHEKNIWI